MSAGISDFHSRFWSFRGGVLMSNSVANKALFDKVFLKQRRVYKSVAKSHNSASKFKRENVPERKYWKS